MHCVAWTLLLLQLQTTFQRAQAVSVTARPVPDKVKRIDTEPSQYPYGDPIPNEMKYKDYTPSTSNSVEKDVATKLHTGFEQMIVLARLGRDEAIKKSDLFKRWFDVADADKVRDVFSRIAPANPFVTGATDLMKDWVNMYNQDGDPPYLCDQDPNRLAYSRSSFGRWHMCRPTGQNKPQNDAMTCDDIDGYASRKMVSIGMLMLHEAVHWVDIGDFVLAQHIKDYSYQAYRCFHDLTRNQKLTNAQNYAFLAAEASFTKKNCPLQDPPRGTVAEDEAFDLDIVDGPSAPSSAPSPPPPPPPPPPPEEPKLPFNPGVCCFHFTETMLACHPRDKDLVGTVKLVDGKGQLIGETPGGIEGTPVSINAKNPLHLKSKLKNELVITGEHRGDYVQFTVGGLSWRNDEPNVQGRADCGREPSKWTADFFCLGGSFGKDSTRTMDCCFPCDKDT